MSLPRTRRRLVNFRLTDEELASLKVACLIAGARTLSDFARTAVLALAHGRLYPEASPVSALAGLAERLERIERTVNVLAGGGNAS